MIGILLIHGFAGSRKEVISLGLALKEQGYKVVMPVLSGHENGYINMSKFGYKDWINSAQEAYISLVKEVDDIIVIGFSMGGLIAINLAQKYKFKALVTINTPIYHWNFPQIIKNMKIDTKKYGFKYIRTCFDKPINSLIEFKILLRKTIPLVKNITCDTLVIQTLDDDTTVPRSVNYFKDILGENCQVETVEKGGHIVLCSPYKEAVISKVLRYVKGR